MSECLMTMQKGTYISFLDPAYLYMFITSLGFLINISATTPNFSKVYCLRTPFYGKDKSSLQCNEQ